MHNSNTQSFNNGLFLRYDKNKNKYYIFEGNMLLEKGKIIKFTKEKSINYGIDLNNKFILPIFKNAHIHLGETLFAPLIGKWDLDTYLKYTEFCNRQMKNKHEMWKYSADLTVNECLRYGTGVICAARGVNVLKNRGIKFFSGYPIMKSKKLESYISDGINGYISFYNDCKENNISPGIFLHSLYTNDYESLELVSKCLKYGSNFITVHVAETIKSEERVMKQWNGRTSIQVLKDYDLLSNKTILVHGCHLNKNDLELISKNRCKMVICPVSNKKLQTSCIEPSILENYNITWCTGSDGLATGITGNMLYHAKELKEQFPYLNYSSIFKSITNNASKVLDFYENEVLEPSFSADFIVVDLKLESVVCDEEIFLKQLINESPKVLDVFIDGKKQEPSILKDSCLEYNNISLETAILKISNSK